MKGRKYVLSIIICFIFMFGVFSAKIRPFDKEVVLNAQTLDERELKAVWVTPLVGDVSVNGESTFRTNMTEVLNIMDSYGLNALIFHVRTHNNALYPSSINPKATYISNIDFSRFDPIEWLIDECHKRGIEMHAWMNPYRYSTTYQTGTMPSANPQSSSSNLLEGKILNPALSNVKNHIYATIEEFVNRYPTVDAIHFDDYFYVSTTASPTSADARRAHINELISGIHSRLASFNEANNRHVQFGISPTGIYRNGNGVVTYDALGNPITTGSQTTGQQHYGDYLYADTLYWIKQGWLDYIMPQVYWARDLSAAPFLNVLSWWDKVVRYLDVNLYTGIGLYKALESSGAGWYTNSNEMNAQFNIIENDLNNVLGYSIYSFRHLKMAYNGDTSRVGQQVTNAYEGANAYRKNIRVLPEIKSMTPVVPNSVSSSHASGTITWNSVSNAKFYYIYGSSGELTYSSDEIIGVIGDKPGVNTFTVSGYNASYNYGVRALSPTNHLSPIAAAPPVEVYNITYNLNGGSFTDSYATRDEMIVDFLTDFYNFLQPEVNLTTFMHGSGNTSGYDGLYDGDYFNQLYNVNDKTVNPGTGKFINQTEYNKWVPLLDLIDEYTNVGYPPQTFWGSRFVGQRRIKPFIQQINLWEEDGEPKASQIMEILNRMPTFESGNSTIYYQYTKNYPDIILPNASKEDYRFLGWYDDPVGGTRVTVIPTGSTGDKTFYARWELITAAEEVLVTFNLDYEGKYLTPQTIEKGTCALQPANPTREHYTFTGWYNGGVLFDFSTPVNNDLNLVAGWTFSSYIVKFIDHDGTVLKTETVVPSGNATAPSNPTRIGYTFIGWDKTYKNVQSNLNVNAVYAIAKYFVEFVDSGEIIDSVLVDYNTTVSEPTQPIKEGYTFIGWYLNDQPYNFSTPVTSDIVLTAWWDSARYNVTYLNYDGSTFLTQSVEEGGKATRPQNNPYREGYTFDAWTLNSAVYDFNNPVMGNITLVPTWDILVHTVRFLNYDQSEISRSSVNHGSKATRPNNPLRYGYTFKDWYLGDLPYNFNYAVYEDVNLIAHWDINIYIVKFLDYDNTVLSTQNIAHGSGAIAPTNPNNKAGHTFIGWDRSFNNIVSYTEVKAVYQPFNLFVDFIDEDNSHIDTATVPYGNKVTRPTNPYKEGYVFAGWLLNGSLFDFETIIYEDITLKASYEFGGHLVTFLNYDGSTFIQQTVSSGGYVGRPQNNPQREGYSFVDWNYNGSPFDFNTKIYSDLTITPSWTILVHTVRFIDGSNVLSTANVNHGSKVTRPTDPVKTGLVFTDWYLGELPYNFNYNVYEDIDLYARWETAYYKVRFIDYDGTILKEYNNVPYGNNVLPPASPNNKPGHYFLKWDKSSNNITANTDINAVYQKNSYFVSLYNYDNSIIDTFLVPYEELVEPPTNVYREGHTFIGWYLSLDYETEFNVNTPITEDIDLYARWSINVYTVDFLDRGVQFAPTQNISYGSKATKPASDPVREDYTFLGWYLGNSLYDFNNEVKTNITLTAKWVLAGYTVTFLNATGGIFKTVVVEPNTPVAKPDTDPVKEGYTFDAWLLGGISYPFSWPVTQNITLEPNFIINKYTVRFLDSNASLISSVVVNHGSKVSRPTDPTKDGHTFKGWNLGELPYNFNLEVFESFDLVAQWSANVYRVRFFYRQTLLKSEDVIYGGDATPPVVPINEGYTFTGWDKSYTNITENVDINAKEAISTYQVTFKDYEKTISVVTVNHGTTATAPSPTVREGYNFVGWDKDFSQVVHDLVVTALYERIQLTVKYYNYYNNIIKEETVNYGEYLTPPTAPIVEGATFDCWLKDGETEYNVSAPVKENLNLYANYNMFEYTVRFLDYDNTLLKTEQVYHGNPATPPANPTRSGYIFTGWDKDYSVIKSNLDISAVYVLENAETFTVKFLNDDNSVIREVIVNSNATVTKPTNPNKVGYTFKCWLLNGVEFNFTTPITADTNLIASYEPIIYQVIYRDKDIVAEFNVAYNELINVPAVPARLGYEGAWSIDLTNIKIKQNYDISAVYTPINYLITYHNVKNATNNNPNTHTILEVVELLPLIPAEGENGFIGWFDVNDNEVLVLSGAGNKEIYAKWQYNEYTVKFIDYNGTILKEEIVEYGGAATAPTAPTRAHYTHIGWDQPFTNVRTDLIVMPLYKGNDYILTFNTDGGTVIPSQTVTYPNLPVMPNSPIKVGHTFTSWYRDSNFNQQFSFNEPLEDHTTIYANYQRNTYYVTFVDDKGNVIEQTTVLYGGTALFTKAVKKEHYTHVGWDKPLENIKENQTITAVFEPNKYILRFNTVGGSAIDDITIIYPNNPTTPLTPIKEGYDFVGWYTNISYTTRFNFDVPLTKNTTIFARWLEALDDNLYISLYQSASIRYKTETSLQGLRFSARLNEDVKNNEHGFYLVYGSTTVEELRIAINTNTGELMLNGKKVYKVIVPSIDADNTFSVVLTGIPSFGYIDQISAIGYVLVHGEEQYTLDTVKRSVAEVAFGNLNNGEDSNALNEIVSEMNQKVVLRENVLGNIELNNNYFEYNHNYLKEEFNRDFNKCLNKDYAGLNILSSDLNSFYSNLQMKNKWSFLLEYFLSLSNNTNLNTQINNLKASNYGGNLDELIYALYNFFNEKNEKINEEVINFKDLNKYLTLRNYNNKVYINPSKYPIYKIGEKIVLSEVADDKVGYVFKHYLINGVEYNPLDIYTVTNNSVVFEKIYDSTNFKVTFISDGAHYYEVDVNPYERLTSLPFIYKKGYNFIGWYTENDTLYDINTKVTSNLNLYAKYELINYINVVDVYINKSTYQLISTSGNVNVEIYYDYNYVDVIVTPLEGYEFSSDVIVNIYFGSTLGKVVTSEIRKDSIHYVLDDPNYTGIY